MLTETVESRKKSQAQVTWSPATCSPGMRLGSVACEYQHLVAEDKWLTLQNFKIFLFNQIFYWLTN